MHERQVKLQAEMRGMGWSLHARNGRKAAMSALTIDNAAKLNTLGRALMLEIVEAIERSKPIRRCAW